MPMPSKDDLVRVRVEARVGVRVRVRVRARARARVRVAQLDLTQLVRPHPADGAVQAEALGLQLSSTDQPVNAALCSAECTSPPSRPEGPAHSYKGGGNYSGQACSGLVCAGSKARA